MSFVVPKHLARQLREAEAALIEAQGRITEVNWQIALARCETGVHLYIQHEVRGPECLYCCKPHQPWVEIEA